MVNMIPAFAALKLSSGGTISKSSIAERNDAREFTIKLIYFSFNIESLDSACTLCRKSNCGIGSPSSSSNPPLYVLYHYL